MRRTKNSNTESCQQALERLLEGNRRFAENRPERPRADATRRAALRKGQRPFAAVLGCADSRVPVELIFDQGLGDLFSVRVAGNVAAPVVVGSIEYAVAQLGVQVVVVLGHEGCGAVSAVLEGASGSDSLETILADIRPAIAAAQERGGQVLDTAVRQNVMNAASALPARSVVLRSRLESGDLLIVPLCYRLESGRVERLEF